MPSALALMIFSCSDMFVLYLWLISSWNIFALDCVTMFSLVQKKALLQRFQRMSYVCLFLVISYSRKILGNCGFLRVCFTTLFYSGLHLHTGMEEHCQNTYLWFLDKCSCSVCQWRALPLLFSSIFSATDWYVYANRYVDELFSSHSKHLQWGLSSTDIEW